MNIRYSFLIFFIFLFTLVNGQQDRIKFSRISVEEGLSQSSAFAIAHDSTGYIWIGTYDGLNRYSGYDIKTYRHDTNDSLSLSDNYIQALEVDELGQLWVGTNSNGICVFSHIFEEFIPIPFKSEANPGGLNGNSILTLVKMDVSTMVALTNLGINLIDINTKACTTISTEDYAKLENAPALLSYFNKNEYNCYLKDSKGDEWKGTDNGLYRKAIGSDNWKLYQNTPFNPNSLSSNEVTSIIEDRGGVIWIGTSLGGVCKWDRLNQGILLYRNNPVLSNTLSHNKVRSFYKDSQGRIWVGTVAGGLNLWDRKSDTFKSWTTKDNVGLNNNHIREVIEWEGNYIIATDGAGLQIFDPNQLNINFADFPIEGMSSTAHVWDIHVRNNELWIATNDQGLFLLKKDVVTHFKGDINTEKITWVTSDKYNNIWVATFGEGLYCKTESGFKNFNTTNSDLSDNRIYSIVQEGSNLWLGTKGGVNHYEIDKEKFTTYSVIDGLPNETVMGIIPDQNQGLWITTNRGICHFMLDSDKVTNYDINNGLQNNEFLVHSFLKLSTGEMLFGGINGFNVISKKGLTINPHTPQIAITQFAVASGDWFTDSTINEMSLIELSHYQNEFSFEFAALGYAGVENNTYQYKMEGFDDDWKNCGKRRFAQYTNLPNGKYTFKVKAANNDGIWNETPASIQIIISPAFWQTWWFKILVVVIILFLLFSFYKFRIKHIQKRNQILEQEVKIRTKEVVEQKQEIENKNHIIAETLKDVHDSITYAKRIQYAILPPTKLVESYLPNSFIIYIPKDIVAGDFYWLEKKDNKILFAAADCTGHGVPGAMVSVVCNNALNRAVREYGLSKPSDILNQVRDIVVDEFESSEDDVKDGMDIALCSIDGMMLEYAGAHNPIWIIRNGEILETKANKQPIGKFDYAQPFTNHQIQLQKDDMIYIFSDGYADQFGGERGKKFKSKAFKNLVLSINNLSLEEQKSTIESTFHNWKGDIEQLDDVCVIGVRV